MSEGAMRGKVLVVDDEKNMGLVIQAMLERAGFEVLSFFDAAEAADAIESEELDAVVTDLYMPGIGGMEILKHVKMHQPETPVVMITAFGTVESAVNALKRGAFDFITKPFDQTELLEVIEKACRTHRERLKEPSESRESAENVTPAPGIDETPLAGTSARVMELRRAIERVAASDTPVLLEGESGTGKEYVALEIHRGSKRGDREIVRVNCAVIPANLIESELFGYERGAFTGAVTSKPGRFELAHEGTLFLDEISELPADVQAKLLRVLEEEAFERVGGLSTIRANVRIVAASVKNLAVEVAAGRFRQDLFYRLNALPIEIPPLRERKEDIDPLLDLFAQRFAKRFPERFSGRVPRAEARLRSALRDYRWPGNIRQLENAVERMVLMGDSETLSLRDLPEEILAEVDPSGESSDSAEGGTPGFKELVRRQTQITERGLIERALSDTDGNVTRAAQALGLSRKGLQLKMKELGIRR